MRFEPKLMVLSNEPTKTFLLFALTSRQPLPPIIFSPRRALLPLIMMLVVLPAISPSKKILYAKPLRGYNFDQSDARKAKEKHGQFHSGLGGHRRRADRACRGAVDAVHRPHCL